MNVKTPDRIKLGLDKRFELFIQILRPELEDKEIKYILVDFSDMIISLNDENINNFVYLIKMLKRSRNLKKLNEFKKAFHDTYKYLGVGKTNNGKNK